MYELAKSLRAKMKAKAKSLANEKDSKVDSSDWSPAEPLNADVKTGMRPISRSAYKAGGKVAGEATEPRADRQPRKKAGEVKSWVDAKVNRNVKDANEEREGIKHVGGLKKGGRAKREDGGNVEQLNRMVSPEMRREIEAGSQTPGKEIPVPPVQPKNLPPRDVRPSDVYDAEGLKRLEEGRKAGGRTKRKDGGAAKKADGGRTGKDGGGYSTQKDANETPSAAEQEAMRKEMERQRQKAQEEGAHRRKDGGAAKKMAKPKPRVGKFYGGALEMTPNVGDSMPGEYAHGGQPMGGMGAMGGDSRGIGPSPAMTNPMNRKAGGRAKGKPHISIMINAGQKQPDPMGGAPMGGAPAGVPVPMSVPPPGMPPMPMGGMPMPPPAPPIGGGLPGGMPPMARRAGGRIARSYKDMDAGAGSGEGRLEKSEIQKRKR